MRILYSHRIQSRDGQSVHVEEIVAALRAAGHEVLVVGPGFYAQSDFGAESSTVARLRRSLPQRISEIAELAYNLPAYCRLRRAAREFAPELIYERYNLFYLAGAWLARRLQLPFYVEVNSPLAEERTRFGGLRLAALARRTERYVWRAADRVFVVTGVLGEHVRRDGVPAERITLTPNGIDPDRFAGVGNAVRADGTVVLGFVGFVRTWHGLDAVISELSSAENSQIHLVVVGDGPALPALQEQTAALGLEGRVRFTGLAKPAAVPALVAGFDIALQPKSVPYASPLKVFDYMAAGRAIVAPDQSNIREILEHNRTALLFDPAEKGAMWQAVLHLAKDETLRRQIGEAAREEIARRDYTWGGNVQRIMRCAAADLSRREVHRSRASGAT